MQQRVRKAKTATLPDELATAIRTTYPAEIVEHGISWVVSYLLAYALGLDTPETPASKRARAGRKGRKGKGIPRLCRER